MTVSVEEGHHPLDGHAASGNPRQQAAWGRRWQVVTGTKTRMYQSVGLYSAQVVTSLALAITVGVNGRYGSQCFLQYNRNYQKMNETAPCTAPITESILSLLLAVAICVYNVRSLKLFIPRNRYAILAEIGFSAVMAFMMCFAGGYLAKAISMTCRNLEVNNKYQEKDCAGLIEMFFVGTNANAGLAGLKFGVFLGFLSGALWAISAVLEYFAYTQGLGI
ncbi:uncharacterized protein EV422DRAFT_522844 [Fimicolochytrium jonesii]|uniref:uncharacterized protein n=1 Tax=Fimicolochytrium jonesii TaxID=1396493 RepID=UPI0022FF24D0|nr:uncharacterized protein EV422DRAFT_522844 [Fimicolochytrium jonesii]KAI8822964.1 hypothetical protein EV422DRAFT_522844 [Fimicolochytrium jonesii]